MISQSALHTPQSNVKSIVRTDTYNYTGPMELTQYFIRSFVFKEESLQKSIFEVNNKQYTIFFILY